MPAASYVSEVHNETRRLVMHYILSIMEDGCTETAAAAVVGGGTHRPHAAWNLLFGLYICPPLILK